MLSLGSQTKMEQVSQAQVVQKERSRILTGITIEEDVRVRVLSGALGSSEEGTCQWLSCHFSIILRTNTRPRWHLLALF